MKRIAFTGTREGPTKAQLKALRILMRVLTGKYPDLTGHHGCCVGADLEFARAAHELGWYVVGHPSDLDDYTSDEVGDFCDEILSPRKPLERNRDVVDAGEFLIACPKDSREVVRSGTWSTVRYARKVGKSVTLILPDGSVDGESDGR